MITKDFQLHKLKTLALVQLVLRSQYLQPICSSQRGHILYVPLGCSQMSKLYKKLINMFTRLLC